MNFADKEELKVESRKLKVRKFQVNFADKEQLKVIIRKSKA